MPRYRRRDETSADAGALAVALRSVFCLRLTAGMLARLAAIALAAVLLAASPVRAHEGAATAFASATVAGSRVLFSLTTSGKPGTDAQDHPLSEAAADPARTATLVARHVQVEADGSRCPPGTVDYEPPQPPRASTTYNVEFRCGAPVAKLRITDGVSDLLGRGAHTLLRVGVAGRDAPIAPAVMLTQEQRSAEFVLATAATEGVPGAAGADRPEPGLDPTAAASRGVLDFLPLGVRHLLEGWDHLLFLLALVLPGGSIGNLARIVTAFTVAHSLTLAAAALEQVSVPAAPVEALIALSIAWVAAENLVRMRPMSRRWAVAFAFGLIHGLGFSNVLRDIGLPRDALLPSLLGFNLGIELGQLLVVALLVPALAWLSRRRLATWLPRTLSASILVASFALLVQRL